jgi:AraC family transcriptional regulator of adaptative response / DNA-3-methyladenine glycosylase II
MSPSALRRPLRPTNGVQGKTPRRDDGVAPADFLRITLAYRPPLAWDALTTFLRRRATPGVEVVRGQSYGRTVRLGGRSGVVLVRDVSQENQLQVDLSPTLLPVLMPLLPRLRQLFDLDAEPLVVDAHLERSGLASLVDRHRGVRIPGALDGFEIAFLALLRGAEPTRAATRALAGRVAATIGRPLETGIPGLTRLMPSAERVADAGSTSLTEVGVPRRRAAIIVSVARAVADGTLRLEPGSDVMKTRRALMEIAGVGEGRATTIVMRALYWPDAFPSSDRALQLAAGVSSPDRLRARAESWRPWRAYAALHLWLRHDADVAAHRSY